MSKKKRNSDENDLVHFLSRVSAAIRTQGWVSSADARKNNTVSTAQTVKNWMDAEDLVRTNKISIERLEQENIPPITEKDISDAVNAIVTTVKTTEGTATNQRRAFQRNSYLQSLYLVAQRGTFSPKEIGLAASIMSYAQRVWESEKKREDEIVARRAAGLRPSEYLGDIGDRIEVDATLLHVRSLPNSFGISTLCKWETNAGDKITWFASNAPDFLAVGRTYILKGTIKDLSMYKGEKQTVLTRCKVADRQPAPNLED